ncbi:MAG: hypothetical protein MJE63_33525 [Proteobacteria bacterium]|nr:hypothetical protein [Pseudomonadota bacterium]
MTLDVLLNKAHYQLDQIKSRLFDTPLARDVDLYTPDAVNNINVIRDEDDFEEADVVGSLISERMPLVYSLQGVIKLIEVRPLIHGRFAVVGSSDFEQDKTFNFTERSPKIRSTVVRNNEINEFEQDRYVYFIAQDSVVPMQAVIQFQVFSNPDQSATQIIRLIKVDERSIGKPAFVNQIHTFSHFHGDLT